MSDFTIMTDHTAVDVWFGSCGVTLLEGRYYPTNGQVVLSDLGSLIESHLAELSEAIVERFTLTAKADDEEDTVDVDIMYCDRETKLVEPLLWLSQNFITFARFQRIDPRGHITLWWYTQNREPISIDYRCTYIGDGKRLTYRYVKSGNGLIAHAEGLLTHWDSVPEIEADIKTRMKHESVKLLSITINCGNRAVTFFIDDSLANAQKFFFTNCFNVVEQLTLHCTTVDKVKADRSVASVGHRSRFYDVTTSKEYEVETGGLTADECILVEQMLLSPNVRVMSDKFNDDYDFDAMDQILITDFTSELSDSDEKLNKVKFTWRYAVNRPVLQAREDPEIFTDKFNPQFS